MADRHRTYLVSYPHDGAKWSIELQARDMADAEARLRQLCFATVDGEIAARIPVPGGRVISRIIDAIRKWRETNG